MFVPLALGVLPLGQLALHLWFARHSFHPGDASKLLACAMVLKLEGSDGSLQPEFEIQQVFCFTWALAHSADEDFPIIEVYFNICQALRCEALPPQRRVHPH